MKYRMAAFNLVIWCPIAKPPNSIYNIAFEKVDATVLLTLEWLSFLSKQRTLALWQPW